MYRPDRIYSLTHPRTKVIEWFFSSREGEIGPYPSKDVARQVLADFVKRRIDLGDDGGRSGPRLPDPHLVVAAEYPMIQYDPEFRRRHGRGP